MPKLVMQFIVESMGYCCPINYFETHPKIPTRSTAKRLGVDRQTVIYWKRKIKKCKGTPCPENRNCARLLGKGNIGS